MSVIEKRLQLLEKEVVNLRVSLEQLLTLPHYHSVRSAKDTTKLLDLFGAWDGEIDTFLQEFYMRRERRGRLE